MESHATPDFDNHAPIGVFDSGVGGLSVLRHIRQRLPHESLIYVADTAWMPYGDKATATIRERTLRLAESLLDAHCKMLVLACNTATAAAVKEVRAQWPGLTVVGMEPGLKPAIHGSPRRKVGILATSGTLRSDKFRLLLERYGAGAEVISQPCPGLVEQVEQGALDDQRTAALLRDYLTPLLAQQIDTLVLGCTHYPFLIPLIRRVTGEQLTIIDTGHAVARQVERLLDERGLRHPLATSGQSRFYTTGDPRVQHPLFQCLWGEEARLDYWSTAPPPARPAP